MRSTLFAAVVLLCCCTITYASAGSGTKSRTSGASSNTLITRLSSIATIRRWYTDNQPEKLKSLQRAFSNFEGREHVLVDSLERKYGMVLPIGNIQTRETALRLIHFFVHTVAAPEELVPAIRLRDFGSITFDLQNEYGVSVPTLEEVMSTYYSCPLQNYDGQRSTKSAAPRPKSAAAKIPRIIFQTFKTQKEVPEELAGWATGVQDMHPFFEYKFFDDTAIEEFISTYYPHYLAIFRSFPEPIMGIDFWRLLAVDHYGGFYLDMDVKLSKSLEPLREFGCVFPIEINDTQKIYNMTGVEGRQFIGQYAFGCTPHHPFVQRLIANIVSGHMDTYANKANTSSNDVILLKTGPGLVSFTYYENPDLSPSVHLLDHPQRFRFGNFGEHFMAGTWRRDVPVECEHLLAPMMACLGGKSVFQPPSGMTSQCRKATMRFFKCAEPYI